MTSLESNNAEFIAKVNALETVRDREISSIQQGSQIKFTGFCQLLARPFINLCTQYHKQGYIKAPGLNDESITIIVESRAIDIDPAPVIPVDTTSLHALNQSIHNQLGWEKHSPDVSSGSITVLRFKPMSDTRIDVLENLLNQHGIFSIELTLDTWNVNYIASSNSPSSLFALKKMKPEFFNKKNRRNKHKSRFRRHHH